MKFSNTVSSKYKVQPGGTEVQFEYEVDESAFQDLEATEKALGFELLDAITLEVESTVSPGSKGSYWEPAESEEIDSLVLKYTDPKGHEKVLDETLLTKVTLRDIEDKAVEKANEYWGT